MIIFCKKKNITSVSFRKFFNITYSYVFIQQHINNTYKRSKNMITQKYVSKRRVSKY